MAAVKSFKVDVSVSPCDSLRPRANAGNVSFRNSLRWSICIVNSGNNTKLSPAHSANNYLHQNVFKSNGYSRRSNEGVFHDSTSPTAGSQFSRYRMKVWLRVPAKKKGNFKDQSFLTTRVGAGGFWMDQIVFRESGGKIIRRRHSIKRGL